MAVNTYSTIIDLPDANNLGLEQPCEYRPDKEKIFANKSLNYFLRSITEPYDPFKISHLRKEIPGDLLQEYYCLAEDTLLADPGEDYASGCVSHWGEPRRQLVFWALNSATFVMVYHHGVMGFSTKALFMRISGSRLIDLWVGDVGDGIKYLSTLASYIKDYRSREGEFPIINEFNPGDYLGF